MLLNWGYQLIRKMVQSLARSSKIDKVSIEVAKDTLSTCRYSLLAVFCKVLRPLKDRMAHLHCAGIPYATCDMVCGGIAVMTASGCQVL